MTTTKARRAMAACTTSARALRVSERLRARGATVLADAFWCRAAELRAVGYLHVAALYAARADELLREATWTP
jgi:hypothetical protein